MVRVEKVPVRAVLWDFGGVLTTSPFDAFRAYEEASGLEPGFIRRLNATNPDTNAWARLERSEVDVEEFAALFEAEAEAAGGPGRRGGARWPPCAPSCARPWSAGRRSAATSTAEDRAPDQQLRPGSFGEPTRPCPWQVHLDLFDVVVESSKVGHRKPDPRFYEIACELLAVEPAEAVFLDDLGVNLKPARAMGMRTIKVTDPGRALADLQQLVDFSLT